MGMDGQMESSGFDCGCPGCLRPGKRGSIDPATREILARLDLEETRWTEMMRRGGQICGTALGHLKARMAEAKRMAAKWLANRCPLFAPSTA